MRGHFLLALLTSCLLAAPPASACGGFFAPDPDVIEALAGDVTAVARLQAAGRDGHTAVKMAHALLAEQYPAASWEKLFQATGNAVGGLYSRLYWHTDVESAQREAAAWQRPILHLRLLGRLDETLSCANSRFFRAILYTDPTIIMHLQHHFVLCWTSERPVPRMTIDFGDGRVVDTTITGNSAHYIQHADGRVLDVLPGLVSPAHFAAWLKRVQSLHVAIGITDDPTATLAHWHAQRAHELERERNAAMRTAGISAETLIRIEAAIGNPVLDAGHLAFAKRSIELPVLHAAITAVREKDDHEVWQRIATHLGVDAALSPEAEAVLQRQSGGSNFVSHDARRQFATDLALDTARNGWRFHATIHSWLAAQPDVAFAALNERIYADLFLTPAHDPWLGLDPSATVSGLTAGGLRPIQTPFAVDTSGWFSVLR